MRGAEEVGKNGEVGLTELLAAEAERHGGSPVVAGVDQIGSGREGEQNGTGRGGGGAASG